MPQLTQKRSEAKTKLKNKLAEHNCPARDQHRVDVVSKLFRLQMLPAEKALASKRTWTDCFDWLKSQGSGRWNEMVQKTSFWSDSEVLAKKCRLYGVSVSAEAADFYNIGNPLAMAREIQPWNFSSKSKRPKHRSRARVADNSLSTNSFSQSLSVFFNWDVQSDELAVNHGLIVLNKFWPGTPMIGWMVIQFLGFGPVASGDGDDFVWCHALSGDSLDGVSGSSSRKSFHTLFGSLRSYESHSFGSSPTKSFHTLFGSLRSYESHSFGTSPTKSFHTLFGSLRLYESHSFGTSPTRLSQGFWSTLCCRRRIFKVKMSQKV